MDQLSNRQATNKKNKMKDDVVAQLASKALFTHKSRSMSMKSDSDDVTPSNQHEVNMKELNDRLKELETPPTKEEIDQLMAQYSDLSDGSICSDSEEEEIDQETIILKVLVVGNARCGKTSTIRRFVTKDFSDEYVSTIGADFVEKTIEYDPMLTIQLQLWDIAGQDRFAKLTRAYFREAKGAVIVCDITRENTIDAVVNWKNEIDVCCKDLNDGEDIPVVLIANKSDLLVNPMGALDIGVNMQKCVDNNGILEWFRASAKNGDHIDDAFQCLLDRMVQNHRAHRPVSSEDDASDSTDSQTYDSPTISRRRRPSLEYHHHKRNDVIRLSSLPPPRDRTHSDSGCGCN